MKGTGPSTGHSSRVFRTPPSRKLRAEKAELTMLTIGEPVDDRERGRRERRRSISARRCSSWAPGGSQISAIPSLARPARLSRADFFCAPILLAFQTQSKKSKSRIISEAGSHRAVSDTRFIFSSGPRGRSNLWRSRARTGGLVQKIPARNCENIFLRGCRAGKSENCREIQGGGGG
jgi:hypothetical protein